MAKTGAESELEKLIKDELEFEMPNLSDVKVSVQDELPPITFVAVSPSFVKCENFDDEETASCEQDPLLLAACKEYSCNGDMTTVKEDEEYIPNLKIKLEPEEVLCFENTVSTKYSEDAFIDTMEDVEIKCESIIDISEEKPIKLSLVKEKCEDDKEQLLSFKEESDIIKCESKESTCFSYKQQMNLEVEVANLNYLEKDDVMERIWTPDRDVESGHSNLEKMVHIHPSEFIPQKEEEECQRSSCSDMKTYLYNVPVCCSEQVEMICATHTSQRSLSCTVCKKTSSENKVLDTHLQTHNGEKLLNVCGENEKSSFLNCVLAKHESSTVKKHFSCAVCEKLYSGQHYLNAHMQLHTSKNSFSCGFCDKKFSHQSGLDKHIPNHATKKPFQCTICEKKFVHKSQLKLHMQSHSGERRFLCSACKKSYVYESTRNRHMQIHSGKRPYLCTVCEKSFVHKNQLNQHMQIHSGEKPFLCSVCAKSFVHKAHLKPHMPIHAAEKPFLCPVCEKSFSFKFQLNLHMKIHSGERRFMCAVCEKSFDHKRDLKSHIQIHSGKRPYLCTVCEKSFVYKSHLNQHMQIHSEEGRFLCSVCEKSYIYKRNLNRHMQIHSGERTIQ